MVMFERGVELARRGDLDGAAVQYQKAIDSGHPDAVAEAGIKLGIVRDKAGDKASAMSAFRAAMATGHPERAPVAAFLLAGVLSGDGRYSDAADAYTYVIDSGHTLAPSALVCQAELARLHRFDLVLAAELFQCAIDSGDSDSAPKAMIGLARLLETNAPDAAVELYLRAIDTEHSEAAAWARADLRALRERRGERVDVAAPPSMRPAVGDSGCHLLLDEDAVVQALWFEDRAAGAACSADRRLVQEVLRENKLFGLMSAGYRAHPDYERGGYLIRFRREP
jgi:tetratricopeptide (TPR) repeat protein